MTQRLAIARALINDPQLLLLDEPYSGLDPRATAVFDTLIAEFRHQKKQTSVVMVSHDLVRGFELASHILILSQGRAICFTERAGLQQSEFADLYQQSVSLTP